MARKLRIQCKGAIYHVINCGNYRLDIFESVVPAHAIEQTLMGARRKKGASFVVCGNLQTIRQFKTGVLPLRDVSRVTSCKLPR